jgi:hypothetical protein
MRRCGRRCRQVVPSADESQTLASRVTSGLVNRSGRHQWDLLRIGDRLEHALRRGLNDAGKPEGQFRI